MTTKELQALKAGDICVDSCGNECEFIEYDPKSYSCYFRAPNGKVVNLFVAFALGGFELKTKKQ